MDDRLLNNNPLFQVNKIHIQEYVLLDMDIHLDHLNLQIIYLFILIKYKENNTKVSRQICSNNLLHLLFTDLIAFGIHVSD